MTLGAHLIVSIESSRLSKTGHLNSLNVRPLGAGADGDSVIRGTVLK